MIKLFLFLFLIPVICFSDNFYGEWKGQGQCGDSIIQIKFQVMIQRDSIVGVILNEPIFFTLADSSFNGTDIHLLSSKVQLKSWNKDLIKRHANGEKITLYPEIKFDGKLTTNKNELVGTFSYLGKIYQAQLFRGNQTAYRPQEPQKPFAYYSEDVTFRNVADSVILGATLTLPNKEGKFPAIILQSGSTPSNRDGESNHHKMFLVLADFLTRNGIAVLRYDDRGVGRSTGDFFKSTPLDLSGDLLEGREFLASREEINSNKIGIIGHSEGGMVAAMAASQSKDFNLIVMLGSAGLRLRDVFEEQTRLRLQSGEMSREQFELQQKVNQKVYKMMELNLDSEMMKDSLKKYKEAFITNYFDSLANNPLNRHYAEILFSEINDIKINPHNLFNLNLNPTDYLEEVTCPVLSLSGSMDRMIVSSVNQDAIRKALINAGNKDFQIIEQKGLNHFFQDCEKGTNTEALIIEQTFSPKALDTITNWILKHVEK